MNKYFIGSDEEVPQALEILNKEELLAADTETDGLKPHLATLWSVQLATREDSFLFPYSALSESSKALLRGFLKDKTIIAHNAKFDYKMLVANGFEIGKVYCTQQAEMYLYAGKYFTFGLKDVLKRRFQIEMSKEPRTIFYSDDPNLEAEFWIRVKNLGHWGAWDEETIEYALGDVEYLHEIYDSQMEDARELGITNVEWLENHVIPVTGDMELRGVWLDDKAVKKFQSRVLKRRDELQADIFGQLEKSYRLSWQRECERRFKMHREWQEKHKEVVKKTNSMRNSEDKRRKSDEAKQMVAASLKLKPFSKLPDLDEPFNPNSPQKLMMALSELTGIDITTTGKEWIEENIHLHPAIETLAEFRKFEKLVQFCELTKEICPKCGMIHANFKQNGTKSGRYSCEEPNLQQIPARTDEAKEFRALFKAPKGHKLVGADLAGIELVILAVFSGETILIEAINNDKDVHCFTMSQFLTASYATLLKAKNGEELSAEEDVELNSARLKFESSFAMPVLAKKEGHKAWVKTLRDYTKTMTYGAVYGLTPYGLSTKFHCNYENAEQFLNLLFTAYPNLKTFLKTQEELGYERGYAVNPLGRRRWFSPPKMKSYRQIEEEIIKDLDKQKRIWDSVTDDEWNWLMDKAIKKARKEFNGKIGSIKRQAGNFFPQSLCAEMIKLAMYVFDRDFKTEDRSEGLILTVHDELWAVCKAENAERCKKVLEESMVWAVKKFMPDVKTKAEAVISDHWVK